jgi:hypothetical protein
MMTEKTDHFNHSFNEEFCLHLEYHLCRTFDHTTSEELKGFWCDGVSWAPYYNPDANREYLAIPKILEAKKITTTAKMGKSGQDYYDMSLILGDKALNNYEHGLSLINCLPGEESMDWIELDIEHKKIELRLY